MSSSTDGSSIPAPGPQPAGDREHWLAGRVFDWSGLNVAHIRPTYFAEWLLYLAPMIRLGVMYAPFTTGRHAPIASEDQGHVIGIGCGPSSSPRSNISPGPTTTHVAGERRRLFRTGSDYASPGKRKRKLLQCGIPLHPYPASAGCATAAGSRRTRLAPPGRVPVLS